MVNADISSDTTVKNLLEAYPQMLQIFLEMQLLCVGCPAEGFHTLAEVAHKYQFNLNDFIENINNAIRDDPSSE